ncbi:MAG: EAL domain-containing protein [Lachnospiraceae bacterium]|nr:EAL domain-containing protein [Lachnospiraceae bacterium]
MERLIYTNEKCVGCHKCISVCSSIGACVAREPDKEGRSYIEVDPNRCIACGACFDACEHGAREFADDTEAFFDALEKGEEISVLIAPAFYANYPDEYETVLGGLKSLGVKRFINVSFGADITTWGYVKYIKEYGFRGGISQPCPAVVGFIEKQEPRLIPKLFPVQSPLMCAAIYARKELGMREKFAFISPCIAKKIEICDPVNKGLVSYNVTFDHLMRYVRDHNIQGEPVTEELTCGLGSIYPMPGGLGDYVRWLLGDTAFIRQIEGEKRMYTYLRQNADKIASGSLPFLFIDALNCEKGCLCGTATDPLISATDDALYNLLNIRENVKTDDEEGAWSRNASIEKRLEALNERFKGLKLQDYLRTYTDRSASVLTREPTQRELNGIFYSMRKDTEESRRIDCTSCGYDNCRQMATAIFNGFNRKENCVYYLKREIEEEQNRLRYQTTHDEFLGLWNRYTAVDILREKSLVLEKYSILMADIDDFKGINTTYGHETGDAILISVSDRLLALTKERGWYLARYGGDEFLLMIPDVWVLPGDPITRELSELFGVPMPVDDEEIDLTVSIGISHSDGVTSSEEHILNAETAMYEAKRRGRNRGFLYDEELKERAREEKNISDRLTEAFEKDGFYMLYQPKVRSDTLKVCGYEALVRMKEPGLFPGKFIPVAEKNGWIWKIGRITTELVVKQLASWKKDGFELHPVSVNFSSNQLSDLGYVDFLEEMLKRYDVPPELVEVEITEGIFLDKTAQANSLFERFKNLGIRLLMDDFGTGYSSLGYLTYIPVDVIKLDKSLVDAYLVDGKDSFIRDVIRLVHDMDKEMIIEGVEEGWQFKRLREFEADAIQGYYFSRPLPSRDAILFEPAVLAGDTEYK